MRCMPHLLAPTQHLLAPTQLMRAAVLQPYTLLSWHAPGRSPGFGARALRAQAAPLGTATRVQPASVSTPDAPESTVLAKFYRGFQWPAPLACLAVRAHACARL